ALGALGIEAGKRGLLLIKVPTAPAVPFDSVFGKRLATTFVKLGPTFIKLGQMLASRPDFIGESVAEELKILFERVPPVSFKQIQKILRDELGAERVKKAFKTINPKPLASASISQTHEAVLEDGTPVILKVQKNNAAELIRLDLSLLEGFVIPLGLLNPKLQ